MRFLLRPSAQEQKLNNEIKAMRKEQSKLSMKDDYTTHVKLERKLLAAQAQLQELANNGMAKKRLFVQYILPYGSQFIMSITLIYISFAYRSEPVIMLGDKFDFTPFSWVMRFPTGIRGAVSVPFWIFVNSFVNKALTQMLT